MANLINTINGYIWATPLIALVFGGAVIYSIVLKFCNIKNIKLQWKLLKSGGGSQEGISPFETFCSVVAYRVAVGNIGGVMVAILYGGPGAVLWMPITALVTSAISYAESYQHIPAGTYGEAPMPPTTEQAVIMLASHFYESRDGSTGGFFADNPQAATQVWNTVNLLLRLDRDWKV